MQATSPDETAIILVHGFGAGVFAWRNVMQPLANSAGCRVIAFDRPAFGQFFSFSVSAHGQLSHESFLWSLSLPLCQAASTAHALHRCFAKMGPRRDLHH